jgi:ABC-2 type transport system permease protein
MNIFKRECKQNLKPFLFWILGLFVLIFAGMTKFTGIEAATGGISVNKILSQFPKVVLAVLGISDIDISTLPGYYAIIAFYVIICGAIYSIHLGSNAVSREVIDKTYEFIFTKPCSKKYVLAMKVLAGWIAIGAFALLNLLFSYAAVAALKLEGNINQLILLYSIVVFVLSSLFFALAIFFSTVAKKAEKGMLYGNLCFLFAFVMSIVYDMLENGTIIKFISPMKYFEAKDLIAGHLDILFLFISICLTLILLGVSFQRFQKNDLAAS